MVRRGLSAKDPTKRRLAELASKKLLVDARKCVERSKELVKGSRALIAATRQMRRGKKRD